MDKCKLKYRGDLDLTQNGNSAAIINWANTSDWTTSTGNGYDGATYKLTFHIETVQYDKYASAWGTEVEIAADKPLPASQYLATNATNPANTGYNDTGADKGKMFQFTHILNEGTENETTVTESRYIGDVPDNYVYFNCDTPQANQEYNYATSCEVWRILGVFDVDDGTGNVEQRMKLVRGSDFATTMTFHGTDYSSSKNDWTISNLNTFLNGDYYNASGDAATYGLKASARSMIGNAVYYLGAANYSGFTTEQLYTAERGNVICGACNSDTTKLTWTGIVGLMYPSDEYMVYGNGVNATCYDNPNECRGTNAQAGWVYKRNILEGQSSLFYTWLLSSVDVSSRYVLSAPCDGDLGSDLSYSSIGVRPVVYLKSSVQIDGGTGASGDPYKLK